MTLVYLLPIVTALIWVVAFLLTRPRTSGEDPPMPAPASVPFLITVAMRARLRALGIKDAEIDKMTPAEAWALLDELDPQPGDREAKAPAVPRDVAFEATLANVKACKADFYRATVVATIAPERLTAAQVHALLSTFTADYYRLEAAHALRPRCSESIVTSASLFGADYYRDAFLRL